MSAGLHPLYLETGLSQGVRISALVASYATLALWLKCVVARVPPGTSRIVLALPAFAVNVMCPWFFNNDEELLQRLSTVFIFSWLCNFKVLAYCWGRAPLRESMTWAQMAAVMALPVFPRPPERAKPGLEGRLQDSAGSGLGLVMRWTAKIALLGAMAYLILLHGDDMPGVLRHYAFAFGLYAFVGFLMDGPAAVAVEGLGLHLVPTFDQPWMSSSLADFWGRRWNITTSSVLRTTVYDSIVDGSCINPKHVAAAAPAAASAGVAGVKPRQAQRQPQPQAQAAQQHQKPSMLRRQLALNATFFVSGVVHEYIKWLVDDKARWGWKWLVFFWMQAPLMSAEWYLSRLMRRAGLQLPRPLCIILTLALLEALAYNLFFGYVEVDTNLAHRVVLAVSGSFDKLLSGLQPLVRQLLLPADGLVQ